MLTVDIDATEDGELTICYHKAEQLQYKVKLYLTVGQFETLKEWVASVLFSPLNR